MGATVATESGERVPVHMGSHGIGVSRLIGAIIEASTMKMVSSGLKG